MPDKLAGERYENTVWFNKLGRSNFLHTVLSELPLVGQCGPSQKSTSGSTIKELNGVEKDFSSHMDCACLSDGRTRQERPTNSESFSCALAIPG